MKVMLVDDEKSLRSLLGMIITEAGYDFCCASDGVAALEVFEQEKPDLAVLDVMIPKMDGFELCARLRKASPQMPILMLSAKGDIVDKKIGFRAGADDYLTKPFNEEELLLRIEALLRRRQPGAASGHPDEGQGHHGLLEPVKVGDLEINPLRYEVVVKGRVVALTPKEFSILALLAESPGKVFTREDLVESLWGADYDTGSVSIPVYIRRIRKKIEEDPSNPRYLQTVWSFGYRLGD
ncbi:MAG: response regulator transcription factor [Coriobacteriaceae bacterium]|jgi:two-component system response regulator VicR|nr:response regulator transcription factor [Coriobacteriaceae bacterium]